MEFYDALLESYEEQPRLFLISTHHIEEIQPLCESLIVIQDGKVLFHEQMEAMREKGVILSGNSEIIEKVTCNASVIETYRISSTLKVMLDESFTSHWKSIASEHGLTIEKASLQDYLINVTNRKIEVKS